MIIRGPSRTEKRFKSLTRLIAEELKKAILAGKLIPGERLSEDKLSGLLKISKVPLREAFRRLEADGFITLLSHNQAVVSKPTAEDIQDSYTIASVLEGLAARLAVQRASEEEITRLRELHQLLREAYQKRDLERYFEANSSFHRFIAEVAGIERLYHLIEELRREIRKTRILSLRAPHRLDYSMREHDQILDAFLKRNPELAQAAAVKHLENQMQVLKTVLDQGDKVNGAASSERK